MAPGGYTERAEVVIQDGLIAAVGEAAAIAPSGVERLDADRLIVAPGLIDIQLNGGFGHDFTHEPTSIWEVGARLPPYGVTSFMPTVITSAADARKAMLAVLRAGPPATYRGATPLGVHFEGPFINPERAGAHDPNLLREPTNADADVAGWSPAAGVRMVTLAPELPGALELTRSLVQRGVLVSAGHSGSSRDQATAGFDAGITYVTHLFNAMSPLGHREPGLAGAALAHPRLTVGLIADGIHVHVDVLRIAAAAAGPTRVSLVTDATATLGMAAGRYLLGGRDVVLDGISVRLADDGRLAGSAISADEGLRRFASASGWPAHAVIGAMTSVPARVLGLTDRGAIAVGARADLALLSEDLRVVAIFVGGERWR